MTPRGQVFGLDFGAVMAVAAARGAPIDLLADILPDVEPAVVAHYQPQGEDDGA